MAGEFRRLDPTYVRSFFGAVASALKAERTFAWQPVLELAAWVTAQPREIPGRKGGGHFVADPDWGWSRDAIIDLLTSGFDEKLPGGSRNPTCDPWSGRCFARSQKTRTPRLRTKSRTPSAPVPSFTGSLEKNRAR